MFVVKYTGAFGFIKPWTAVRDGETFSQQFLTPSIIEGMRQKLEVSEIIGHRLSYTRIDKQQEVTQSKGANKKGVREKSIIIRGVMVEPVLYLAFSNRDDAEKARLQHICLCRNEDLMLPSQESPQEVATSVFYSEQYPGFELKFGNTDLAFLVGFNRFVKPEPEPMYGELKVYGNPLKRNEYA